MQIFEKKDSLKIKNNKKSKKKTFAGPIQNYIRVSYRDPNSNYRQVERKFEGEELDILPSAQIIISEIPTLQPPQEKILPIKIIQLVKRLLSAGSDATSRPHLRGGLRINAGRLKREKKVGIKRRSLKKNKKYARHHRRIRYEMGKGKLLQRVDNEEKIVLLQEAIAGKTSLECLLEGDKKWSELTEHQQERLFRRPVQCCFIWN